MSVTALIVNVLNEEKSSQGGRTGTKAKLLQRVNNEHFLTFRRGRTRRRQRWKEENTRAAG